MLFTSLGETLFLFRPLFLHLYIGEPAQLPALGQRKSQRRRITVSAVGRGRARGKGIGQASPEPIWKSRHRVFDWNEGSCHWRTGQVRGRRTLDSDTFPKRGEVGPVLAGTDQSGRLECVSQEWLSHCPTMTVSHAFSVSPLVPFPVSVVMHKFLYLSKSQFPLCEVVTEIAVLLFLWS